MLIPLTLYRCLGYGLKMCILFPIFFVTNVVIFLPKWIDTRYLKCAAAATVLSWLLRNFTGVGVLVWKYAYCLDIKLRFFLSLFLQVELVHFKALLHSRKIDSWHRVCVKPPTVLCRLLWNFTYVFVMFTYVFVMVWRYAYILDIVLRLFFVTFIQVEFSRFLDKVTRSDTGYYLTFRLL